MNSTCTLLRWGCPRIVYTAISVMSCTSNIHAKFSKFLCEVGDVARQASNPYCFKPIDPRRACSAKVTVLGLCVCLSICLSVSSQLRVQQEILMASA